MLSPETLAHIAMAAGFPEAQRIGLTAKQFWPPRDADVKVGAIQLFFSSHHSHLERTSSMLLEERIRCSRLRRMAIKMLRNFGPHGKSALEKLSSVAVTLRVNDPKLEFLYAYEVEKDVDGSPVLRGIPIMRHRPVLSEAGAAFCVAEEARSRVFFDIEETLIVWEGFAAIVARDYDWFCSGSYVDEEMDPDVEAWEAVEASEDEEAWWSSSNESA